MKTDALVIIFTSLLMLAFEVDKAAFHFDEGMKFKAAGQLDQAEENFQTATQMDPLKPEYHFELSNIYAMRYDRLQTAEADITVEGMLRSCMRELEQTLRLEPNFVPAIYNLGVVYKNLGEQERAREQFRKVLQKDPQQVNAFLQIGDTYATQGFFDEARDEYKKAKELDFANPDIDGALKDLDAWEKQYNAVHQHSVMLPPGMMSDSNYRKSLSPIEQGNPISGRETPQAIPFAGMTLLQEFMKNRQKKQYASPF